MAIYIGPRSKKRYSQSPSPPRYTFKDKFMMELIKFREDVRYELLGDETTDKLQNYLIKHNIKTVSILYPEPNRGNLYLTQDEWIKIIKKEIKRIRHELKHHIFVTYSVEILIPDHEVSFTALKKFYKNILYNLNLTEVATQNTNVVINVTFSLNRKKLF